jgi:hypothetical protein
VWYRSSLGTLPSSLLKTLTSLERIAEYPQTSRDVTNRISPRSVRLSNTPLQADWPLGFVRRYKFGSSVKGMQHGFQPVPPLWEDELLEAAESTGTTYGHLWVAHSPFFSIVILPSCFSSGRRWSGSLLSFKAHTLKLCLPHEHTTRLRIMSPLSITQAKRPLLLELHHFKASELRRLVLASLRPRLPRMAWETLLLWAWACQTRATYFPPTSPTLRQTRPPATPLPP